MQASTQPTKESHHSILPLESPAKRPWREISILSVMVMEVCWVVPWFRTLTIATEKVTPLMAFGVLISMMLTAHLSIRLLVFLRLKRHIRQGIVLVLLMIGLFAGFRLLLYQSEQLSWLESLNRPLKNFFDYRTLLPDEVIVLIIVVIAWWRGIALAQDFMGPSTVMSQFAVGMVMFVFYVLLVMLGTQMPPPLLPFYLFLFATLVGMTAARISSISTLRGGRQVGFDRRWFIGVVGVAGILVAAAFGIVQYGGGIADVIGVILMILISILALLVWAIVAPLFYWLSLILERVPLFSNLAETLMNSLERIVGLGNEIGKYLVELIEKTGIMEFLARTGPVLRLVCLGGAILFLVGGLLAWAALRLWRDRSRRVIDEDQNSLDADEFIKMIGDALRRRLAQIRYRMKDMLDHQYAQRLKAAVRIRQIYADLMDLSAKLKLPRPEAQTPLEFLPAILGRFPGSESEVELITDAYLRVRYGMLPESKDELDSVERAWKQIEEKGQMYLREQAKKRPRPSPGV